MLGQLNAAGLSSSLTRYSGPNEFLLWGHFRLGRFRRFVGGSPHSHEPMYGALDVPNLGEPQPLRGNVFPRHGGHTYVDSRRCGAFNLRRNLGFARHWRQQ